eukprot:scaffold137_cov192-Alexandrium_tamarense.AAC.8
MEMAPLSVATGRDCTVLRSAAVDAACCQFCGGGSIRAAAVLSALTLWQRQQRRRPRRVSFEASQEEPLCVTKRERPTSTRDEHTAALLLPVRKDSGLILRL